MALHLQDVLSREEHLGVCGQWCLTVRSWEAEKHKAPLHAGLLNIVPHGHAMGTVRLNALLTLSPIQVVGLLPQVRRQRPESAVRSWRSLSQPLQSFLHKPLYPLVGMATAHADCRGNVGDRHPVSQEYDHPGTPGKARRDGRCPLPRQERLTLGKCQADGEGGFASTSHTEPS